MVSSNGTLGSHYYTRKELTGLWKALQRGGERADPGSELEKIMVKSTAAVAPETMRGRVVALFHRHHFGAILSVGETPKSVGAVGERTVFSMKERAETTRRRL